MKNFDYIRKLKRENANLKEELRRAKDHKARLIEYIDELIADIQDIKEKRRKPKPKTAYEQIFEAMLKDFRL